ncbi:enoyl-CoA hydratase-related protein [Croceicoccus sp. BE223]|uniref:enoyl-CoA hydratase/isomerase family protein n=1 Tax=Croceicoccus sp. BE223 TaxID=2817716 RepID=UPI0028543363|nr:enoyl-CoA hydratase-related protein [Croceicoccus sp. BE223]MDR7101106.1 enoyl-CoA hydratase/carnithine racemase [Croceicoccus sp. BE223]
MTEAQQPLLVTRQGFVSTIMLNRPESINAFNDAMRGAFRETVRQLEADEDTRVIVLCGAGERGFCAGADVKEGRTVGGPVAERRRLVPNSWIEVLDECTKPTIAAVHGVCYGGGLELALACDIRMAARDARFGLTETRLGLIPGGGGTQRLSRLIGLGPALDLVLTADRIDASRAYELGLVTRLSPDREALEGDAMALATAMAERPPAALAYAKEAMIEGYSADLRGGLRLEKALFALLMGTRDRREAAEAFRDKRSPVFKGE